MKTTRLPTKPLIQRRYLAGQCTRCCQPRPANDQRHLCPECRARQQGYWQRYALKNLPPVNKNTRLRRERVRQGLCTDCAVPLEDPGTHCRCPKCLVKKAAYRASRNAHLNRNPAAPPPPTPIPELATMTHDEKLAHAVQLFLSTAFGGKGLDFDTAAARAGVKRSDLKQAISRHNEKNPRHRTPYLHGRSSKFTLGIW